MSVQTNTIEETSLANSRFIINRILFDTDEVKFVEEDQVRVVDKLLFAVTPTGFTFVFVSTDNEAIPHDIGIGPDGSLMVSTATERHDLSKYKVSEITIKEWCV